MDNFETESKKLCDDLYVNLGKFVNKSNHSAGTKARKNAQQLKKLLQSLREDILNLQKERKEQKQKAKVEQEEEKEAEPEPVVEEKPVVEAKPAKKPRSGKKKRRTKTKSA